VIYEGIHHGLIVSRGNTRSRLALGFAQMFAASFAVALLVWSGVNAMSLCAAVAASGLTMLSVLRFKK
jgi:hypothetical protein